jgi:hypothetical protein
MSRPDVDSTEQHLFAGPAAGVFAVERRSPLEETSATTEHGHDSRRYPMSTTETRPKDLSGAQGALRAIGHGLPSVCEPFTSLILFPPNAVWSRLSLVPAAWQWSRRNNRVFGKARSLCELDPELLRNRLTCPHSDHPRRCHGLQPSVGQSRMPGYGRVRSEQLHTVIDPWRDRQILDMIPPLVCTTPESLTAEATAKRAEEMTVLDEAAYGPSERN